MNPFTVIIFHNMEKRYVGGLYTDLCDYPYLVLQFFAILLFLHLVTFQCFYLGTGVLRHRDSIVQLHIHTYICL